MFVFPAFDTNYKTRKRTFKCCQNCRIKRTKCEITSTDYEALGCLNCRRHKFKCSLIKKKAHPTDEPQTQPQQQPLQQVPQSQSQPQLQYQQISQSPVDDGNNRKYMTQITPQYLHDTFNFNTSTRSDTTFQYLFHGHPKVIISSQDKDQTIYHESGVYVKTKKEDDKKSYKIKHFGSDTEKHFNIKSEKVYQFLLSINAFTLSSPDYPISKEDEVSLLKLYFYKTNSIFPLVQENFFWKEYNENKAQNTLIYGMVLAISRDKLAEPILKRIFSLGSIARTGHPILEMNQEQYNTELVKFMSDLEFKIRQLMLILVQLGDEDKFSRIAVHLLLSLHFGYDRLGNEQSAHDLMDAIGIGTAIGIHMKRLPQRSAEFIEYSTNLWWCCYVFDRFNGLVNARPCFIKSEDFNVDLPYSNITLLKMVQIARNLENMFFAVFQPFNNNNIPTNNSMARYSKFNIDEFQKIEFELCEQERSSGRQIYSIGKTSDKHQDYILDSTHLLTRVVNNVVILASQKGKYDNPEIPNHIPEAIALRASSNMLWYLSNMPDEYLIQLPMIPWCMSLGMAVALKKYARQHVTKYNFSEYDQYHDEYEFESYVSYLEKFSATWYVVDEICRLTRDFTDKLEKKMLRKKKRDAARAKEEATIKKAKKEGENSQSPQSTNRLSVVPEQDQLQTSSTVPPIPIIHTNSSNVSAGVDSNIGESPFMHPDAPFDPASTGSVGSISSDTLDQYDQYFESMQIDIFNNDFFKDVPNVINLLN
ncbi:uncharacterized protein SPAPADRAFT_138574 [Spathaspora passalidarum NRRL Y-27907]|uniref:Xylanolytic transcriptional activator regulatory domain-containing protein n=1 Tax=Spathaspora passalidarum (strain NRRL Y-27907 / 11-Y1) TaxID=619300 RepID=G3ANB0_SPAPN|nr:uncharacterized protein SPAPADRAFT_138574 [Spathaspora passalidarum NRRL Y-27907]EGW32493.1 hypothetical protein SPAPADRAFT_138574 [Spathaspora passalidarum NRRL Y-27907]